MASQVMRITLKAYDHELVDSSAKKIIETVKKNGSQVSGPVPLPTKKDTFTTHYSVKILIQFYPFYILRNKIFYFVNFCVSLPR